jgi:16S rRNA (cytidine1402-2'-O)-methyltransferase
MGNTGRLFLLPNYLSEDQGATFIADDVKNEIKRLDYYLVENVRTTRRFISSLQLGIDISALKFEAMDKRFDERKLVDIFQPVFKGVNLGIQSEAGLPGIADPGKLAVSYAHRHNIQVVTLPGPSSIILGLISSGFNGQQFTFHGYLPIDKKNKIGEIKKLEQVAQATGYTQVFMETPYRNEELFKTLLNTLKPDTYLYIGKDLTGPSEYTRSMKVKEWKTTTLTIGKSPAIFAISKNQ